MQAIEFEADAKGRMIEIPEVSMDEPSFEEQLEIGREFMREYAVRLMCWQKIRNKMPVISYFFWHLYSHVS